jgi:hypothetical protein
MSELKDWKLPKGPTRRDRDMYNAGYSEGQKDRDELLAALKAFGPVLANRVFDADDPILPVVDAARVLVTRIESAKEPS